jgi:hypothetical protein
VQSFFFELLTPKKCFFLVRSCFGIKWSKFSGIYEQTSAAESEKFSVKFDGEVLWGLRALFAVIQMPDERYFGILVPVIVPSSSSLLDFLSGRGQCAPGQRQVSENRKKRSSTSSERNHYGSSNRLRFDDFELR